MVYFLAMEHPSFEPITTEDLFELQDMPLDKNSELVTSLRKKYEKSTLAQQFIDRYDRSHPASKLYLALTYAIGINDGAKINRAIAELQRLQPELAAFNLVGKYFVHKEHRY